MIRSNSLRMPFVLLSALLVNAIIFTVIQLMVVNRQMRLTDASNFEIANFIRMQEQAREVQSRRDPKAPEKPRSETQQDLSRLAQASKSGAGGGLAVDLPDIEIDVDVGGGIQIARELTPLVRMPAEYPYAARVDETEGYVILMFTVTETGSVADPEIIASEPPGVFDRSAIRAVLKWKYQPQLVDGQPAAVVTKTRINFALLDE